MKKLFLCFIALFLLLVIPLSACEKQSELLSHISEVRSDIFSGQSENYNVDAYYGFKESPFNNDGAVGSTEYALVFKLRDYNNAITYSVTLDYNEQTYDAFFEFNPIKNALTAKIVVENFTAKDFTVKIKAGSDVEEVLLKSIVPQNAINYITAIDYLEQNQPALIENYSSQGGFNGEIYARIIVKDNEPYWYIGIATGNEKLKALLIDGVTGEVLAIRDVL